MDIVTDLSNGKPPVGGSAVTIGAYDGVHLGHRALLGELKARAEADGLTTAVVTFDRHPATVVRPESAPLLLCDLNQKLELLDAAGVDRTVVVPFDAERANETAEEFVNEILIKGLDARLVVVGEDFHFGHGRKGNVALLARWVLRPGSRSRGCPSGPMVKAPERGPSPYPPPGCAAWSAAGRMEEAAALLGRPHQVRGEVVRGDQRGGPELGFPTANVAVPAGICLPAAGIYAGWYERPGGPRWEAAVSVGRRPTFYANDGDLLVEAHLLDFAGDLYGEEARVSFVSRLRDEVAFDSVEALIEQMGRDVAVTRTTLAPLR